jgi:hypothetical protein
MPKLTEQNLLKIKEWLQHGDIKAIAEDLKLNQSYVGAVLRGKKPQNIQIIDKATEIALKNKKIVEKSNNL